MTQQFIGIGVEISKATGKLKVVSLLPDTPAYTSGLDADDEILAVDGESTENMTVVCAVSKITGPKGSKVTLTIRHAGSDKTEDITIVRDRIVVPPLRGWQRDESGEWQYMIDRENGIGYIRITNFTETTVPDMDEILRKLEKEGLRGLIIDLRFNSGGYLVSAAGVVDLFVEEGVIVKSEPRVGFSTSERAHKQGTHPNYPLVVLINGQSASAPKSSPALQIPSSSAHARRHTYLRQGSVRSSPPTPGRQPAQVHYGLLPPAQRPAIMNRYEMEKQGRKDWAFSPTSKSNSASTRCAGWSRSSGPTKCCQGRSRCGQPLTRHTLEETLDADKQLAVALLVLKSKMIHAGQIVNSTPAECRNDRHEVELNTTVGRKDELTQDSGIAKLRQQRFEKLSRVREMESTLRRAIRRR